MNVQKYIKINALQEYVLQELRAFDTWPQWWPGVQSLDVIKSENGLSVVDIVFKTLIAINATLEFDLSNENIIKARQIQGWFKTYNCDWELQQAPDGVGTIIKISLTVEIGMLAPKGMIRSQLTQNLNQLETALNKRLQGKMSLSDRKAVSPETAEQKPQPPVRQKGVGDLPIKRKSINIFQTKEGLEIWISGRRYIMK